MKSTTIRKILISTATLVFIIFINTSCKKNVSSPASNMTTFYFHFYPYIDTTPLTDTAMLYKDSSGRYFGLSTAQIMIYNVVLQNTNGSTYSVPDAFILTGLDNGKYLIGSAPPGTYSGVSFIVGLASGTNGLPPSVYIPQGYVPSSTMFYPGPQGYMSMLIQGFADTTSAIIDTGFVFFSYEIGSQQYPETVMLPTRTGSPYPQYAAVANGTDTISVICDYGKLLSVVNFKTQDTTDTYTLYPGVAATIAASIPNMFRYKN